MKTSPNVIVSYSGLLPDSAWRSHLANNDTHLLEWMREQLAKAVPGLIEKFNTLPGRQYFGYKRGGSSDMLYIFIQSRKLVVDANVDISRAKLLQHLGFHVSFRKNFQGRIGWLTGWDIPYYLGWEKRREVLQVMIEAFR